MCNFVIVIGKTFRQHNKNRFMNKIYLLTAMLLVAATAMAGVSAPQRGPQKLAHGLPVPVVKPATNVSDAGFTANWEKASGANCYTVYTYIRHKAPADEIYYFYNDDFSGFKYGSIESPFDIGWGWLDGYTNRSNWYVYGAYSCHGVFGLYNKKSAEQNGMLMSPMYSLQNNNGKFTVTFRAKTTGTATVAVFATEYLMAGPSYALGKVGKVELTKEWADYTLELDGGIQGCYVELDMVGGDSNAYFDNMTISQPMKAGDEAMLVYDFVETGDVSSHDVATGDKVAGDVYWYQVASLKRLSSGSELDDSNYSDLVEVKQEGAVCALKASAARAYAIADGVVVENPEGADVAVYDVGGREVYASRDGAEKQMVVLPSGVYVVKVGYEVVKVMK